MDKVVEAVRAKPDISRQSTCKAVTQDLLVEVEVHIRKEASV